MSDQWDEIARALAAWPERAGLADDIKAQLFRAYHRGRQDGAAADYAYQQGKRDEREAWMGCAMYDALMEGPRFRGWNMSALSRIRQEREGPDVRGLQIDKDGAAALVAAIRSRSTEDA